MMVVIEVVLVCVAYIFHNVKHWCVFRVITVCCVYSGSFPNLPK